MNSDARPPREQLDGYLDRQLSREDTAAFEKAIASDAALRSELELQRKIDAALRRTHVVPDAQAMLARIQAARAAAAGANEARESQVIPFRKPGARPNYAGRWLAAAAAVVLVIGGGTSYYLWSRANEVMQGSPRYEVRGIAQIYDDELKAGFKPMWECRDREVFQRTFASELHQALAFTSVPASASVWGLSYAASPISDRTMEILVKLDEKPILVLVDRADRDKGQTLPASSGLHLHKGIRGNLVLYEISPLPEPHVLPLLEVPSLPAE